MTLYSQIIKFKDNLPPFLNYFEGGSSINLIILEWKFGQKVKYFNNLGAEYHFLKIKYITSLIAIDLESANVTEP